MGDIIDFKRRAAELPPEEIPEFSRGQDFGLALGETALLAAPACGNCGADFAAGILVAFRDMVMQAVPPEDRQNVLDFIYAEAIPELGLNDEPEPSPAA